MAAAAAADAATASPPACPDYAAAKGLAYLCLASMWVGGAGFASAAFADLAFADRAWGLGSPVVDAVLEVSIKAILFGALLGLVVLLLLLRVSLGLHATGFSVSMETGPIEISRASMGSAVRETAVIGWLAALPFVLLSIVGYLVMKGLSPAKGSQTGRIGAVIIDVGVLGSMAICCFVTIPSMALKLWRMSLGREGDAQAGSIV